MHKVDVGIFIFNRCSHRAIIILALFGILSSLSMQTSMSSFSTEASTESSPCFIRNVGPVSVTWEMFFVWASECEETCLQKDC